MTAKRSSPTRYDDELLRRLSELEREVRSARAEARSASDSAALASRALRTGAKSKYEAEARAGWARLDPSVSLVKWQPRQGTADTPEMGTSLIDRLKAGESVSDSLGNVSPFTGATNIIDDPTFGDGGVITAGTTEVMGAHWGIVYSAAVGTPSAAAPFFGTYLNFSSPFNGYSTARCMFFGSSAGALDTTTTLRSWSTLDEGEIAGYPFVCASVKVVTKNPQLAAANITTCTLTLEIYNVATGATIASATHDLLAVDPSWPRMLTCSAPTTAGVIYGWRVKGRGVKAASATAQHCGVVGLGEPQLHPSFTPDPLPFAPAIGRWNPQGFSSYRLSEQYPRMAADGFGLRFSDGVSASSTYMYRYASGQIAFLTLGGADDDMVLILTSGFGRSASLRLREGPPPAENPPLGYSAIWIATDGTVRRTDAYGDDQVLAFDLGYGETWHAPTLTNSWVNYDTWAHPEAGYRIDSAGYVHLQGLLKDGTLDDTGTYPAFTLPAGYRPNMNLHFPAVANSAFGAIRVWHDGRVMLKAASNVWFAIDGITFLAEA